MASVKNALVNIEDILEKLKSEEPNKAKLLRNFRDEFLAHELHFEDHREKPMFGQITELLDEVTKLMVATSLAIEGSSVGIDLLPDQIATSIDGLIDLIDREE